MPTVALQETQTRNGGLGAQNSRQSRLYYRDSKLRSNPVQGAGHIFTKIIAAIFQSDTVIFKRVGYLQ